MREDTTHPTSISRTWAIVCCCRYEASGSIVGRHVHIVTLTECRGPAEAPW